MKQRRETKQRFKEDGFTLIEMIVSLTLFSVVVTVAIGALLMLVGVNDELQGEQSVMTNLSFALDSMTREIRTGTNYRCVTNNVNNVDISEDGVNDCDGTSPGIGIVITEAGRSITQGSGGNIFYYYDDENSQIVRQVEGGSPESMTASDIFIRDAKFFVSGTASGDQEQPTVTIQIEAIDDDSTNRSGESTVDDEKRYFIQTSVTQRALDL